MEFKYTKLNNGLVLVGELNESAKSSAAGFFVKTGSRDENQQISGVSHFLEHMMFKGNERLNAFEVNQAFDNTGAQFNAFTSEENTVYYAAVLPEYLPEIIGLWSELLRPALREDDFNIEKNVIKEEIAMYLDLPSFDILERCRTLYFNGHPCGNSVLGSVQSIDELSAHQMRRYFADRYVPNNMVLVCTGRFDWQQVCELAEKNCTGWQEKAAERATQPCDGNVIKQRFEKANLVREHICLISKSVSAQDRKRFAASLLSTIVGDELGSRFFWELVDKAWAEEASMQYNAMDAAGVFCSYIRCSSDNLQKVLDAVAGIFYELTKNGITGDELQKAKNKSLSALVLKNELPMGRLVDVGMNWIYLNQYLAIEEEVNAIRTVTVDDINSLIEQLQPGNYTQLVMGSKK